MMLSPLSKDVIVTVILSLSALVALALVCFSVLKYHEQSLIFAPITIEAPQK